MKKEYDYGISILRIFFSFLVVCYHYHGIVGATYKYYFLREMTVPFFLTISFYYCFNTLQSGNISKYVSRIKRLLGPYLTWPIVIFFCERIFFIITGRGRVRYRDLVMQLLTGNVEKIDPPLWYLWEVLVFTLVFITICHFFGNKGTCIILTIISLICYYLQYTNVNALIVDGLGYEIEGSVGRFVEVMPCASLGFILKAYNIPEKVKKYKWLQVVFGVSTIGTWLFAEYIPKPDTTFAYSGVRYLIMSFFLVVFTLCLSFSWVSEKVLESIRKLSRYTMGVYCIHWPIGLVMDQIWMICLGKSRTIIEAIVVFLLSFLISVSIGVINNGKFRWLVT